MMGPCSHILENSLLFYPSISMDCLGIFIGPPQPPGQSNAIQFHHWKPSLATIPGRFRSWILAVFTRFTHIDSRKFLLNQFPQCPQMMPIPTCSSSTIFFYPYHPSCPFPHSLLVLPQNLFYLPLSGIFMLLHYCLFTQLCQICRFQLDYHLLKS